MSIGRQAIKSTIYVSAFTYVNFAVTFISSIILARLLEPKHFGIFALVLFFLELFGRVRELGLDQALTHRRHDLDDAYKAHFTLQVLLSALSVVLVLVAYPFMSRFYDPVIMKILLLLSLLAILQAASRTPRVYLEKELAFGRTTLIDLVAMLLSAGLAILSAWQGLGVWSLVVGSVSKTVITFIGFYIKPLWRPSLIWNKALLQWFLKFGGILWLGGVATFILYKYNDFILGTFVDAETLGFYVKALSFAQLPTSLVTSAISRVSFPTYAKLQEDTKKLSEAFRIVLVNIVRLATPLSLILFVTAEEFTRLLLGDKWLPMVPIFRLLILYSLVRPVFDDVGAFLTALGKPHLTVRYLAGQALVFLGIAPLFIHYWGVLGGAWALNLVIVLGVVVAYTYARKFVKINYWKAFAPSVLVSGATLALFYLVLSRFLVVNDWEPWVSLALKASLSGGIYLGLLMLIEGRQVRDDLSFFWKKLKVRS